MRKRSTWMTIAWLGSLCFVSPLLGTEACRVAALGLFAAQPEVTIQDARRGGSFVLRHQGSQSYLEYKLRLDGSIYLVYYRGDPRHPDMGKDLLQLLRAHYPDRSITGYLEEVNLFRAHEVFKKNPTHPAINEIPLFKAFADAQVEFGPNLDSESTWEDPSDLQFVIHPQGAADHDLVWINREALTKHKRYPEWLEAFDEDLQSRLDF